MGLHQPQLQAALNEFPPLCGSPSLSSLLVPLLKAGLTLFSPQCTSGTRRRRGAWGHCSTQRNKYSTPCSKLVTPRGQVGGARWGLGSTGCGKDKGQ